MLESSFDVYYCAVCNVCKNPPDLTETKFCSGCKLVQYCSSSHQREDWPSHKEFCKAIKSIMVKLSSNHLYKEAFSNTEADLSGWNNLRFSVCNLVELFLKRSLTFLETQILLFPPLCNFCHSYDQNNMFSCHYCNTVVYCCRRHQELDVKHKDLCKVLYLSFKIDIQRFFKQGTACNFRMLNDFTVFKRFPDCMESILKQKGKKIISCEELLLSEYLSYSVTLAFAIGQVSKIPADSLTVHIVGADNMELLATNTLPIVFNLLPYLTNLNIVLIGPNLPVSISVPTKIQDKCCVCVVSNMFYHDYLKDNSAKRPDVIAVFNCGFCEYLDDPEKDSWKNSLPCILSFSNSTVILTSYNFKESCTDLKRLCEIEQDACEILMESTVNPFGSLYPHRNWETDSIGVFYVNKYISIIKTK